MNNKTQQAIHNNNDLYDAIFSNYNLKFNRTNLICYSLEKTPPLYSNLVTISKDWQLDVIFKNIDFNYESEKWQEWSIKDSFGVLNLSNHGFTKLFTAEWMYLEADKFTRINSSKKLRYELINNEDILSGWRIAWDLDEQLGKEIFSAELLKNPKVYFVAAYKGEQIVGGCLINKTEDVLGISNFFAPNKDVEYWAEMISFIFNSIERADIVGYERSMVVQKLKLLGFEPAGNLIVWLKNRKL